MATLNAPTAERRHIPERRLGGKMGAINASVLDWAAMLLLIVGGLNWGLVGIIDVNPVDSLFGVQTGVARVVYALVGLAALYGVYILTRMATHKT